ncbi:MAG: hypothetical protein ACR2FI_01470 [Burkholderiales bacterium]
MHGQSAIDKKQLTQLFAPRFERVKAELHSLSGGDARLMWALRRKLAKELVYIERSTPAARNKLKALTWAKQNGNCALCGQAMPQKVPSLTAPRHTSVTLKAMSGWFTICATTKTKRAKVMPNKALQPPRSSLRYGKAAAEL